jgi:S1-C subfamily serine protease
MRALAKEFADEAAVSALAQSSLAPSPQPEREAARLILTELVEVIREATIQIVDATGRHVASGFVLIEPNLVVTACHAVRTTNLTIRVDQGSRSFTGSVVHRDEAADVAIIRTTQPVGRPLELATELLPIGETIIRVAGDGRVDAGRVLGMDLAAAGFPGPGGSLYVSIESGLGDSGAPVVDTKGRVVGMFQAYNLDSRMTILVSARSIASVVSTATG